MDPKESKLAIPKMMTGDQSQNMVYFWISDYTLNTAGEVYHKANKLRFTFNAWEKNVCTHPLFIWLPFQKGFFKIPLRPLHEYDIEFFA